MILVGYPGALLWFHKNFLHNAKALYPCQTISSEVIQSSQDMPVALLFLYQYDRPVKSQFSHEAAKKSRLKHSVFSLCSQ